MDELQAAVLLIKMPHLERWNILRQQHAQRYTEQLQGVVEAVPVVRSWATHVYCYYVIQVPERDRFRQALEAEGVGVNIHYPVPIHLQPACARYGYGPGMLPVTESVSQRIISLPMYPELTEDQTQFVIDTVKTHTFLEIPNR
jgi:dTDP-4-amino-4,6-dideoxygalactose transaminase